MSRRRSPTADPIHKRTLTLRQQGVEVRLEVLEGLFATAGVDAGTTRLLRWLATDRYAGAGSVLDLGCGYGPLGLWLGAADPGRQVLAVDRDARALEATERGAGLNGLADRVVTAGSLGYDDVVDRFDLIVSNLPAKVGANALAHLVLDSHHHLNPSGLAAVVVVDRLAATVAELLDDPAIDVLAVHPSREYAAFEYCFRSVPRGSSAEGGFEHGVYRRSRQAFAWRHLEWEADVSYSIPEFDTVGHGTAAALEVAPISAKEAVAISGVGQGHLALALRAAGAGGSMRLVDRDLLALRTTDANLAAATEMRHVSRLRTGDLDGVELSIVRLPERSPVAVTAATLGIALAGAEDGCRVVIHGRSADVGRVLELLPRHGARVGVERRAKVGTHTAVLSRPLRRL